jgi:hypothetical protein
MDPANVSPLVAWLCSTACDVTGRLFEVEGGRIGLADGWQHGPAEDIGRRWLPADIGPAIARLVAAAPAPAPVYGAQ